MKTIKTKWKWIRLGGDFYFWFCNISSENDVNFVFIARRIWEKDDDWKSTTTDFLYEFGLERVSDEIQWQIDFCCRAMITDFDLWKRMTIGNLRQLIFVWFWLLKRCLKESNDNSILCETITISNERTSPLSGRKNWATNDCYDCKML